MFRTKNPEVLIAGAGPVGLTAAVALARRGIRIQIVDRDWRAGAHSYALALHATSLRLFQQLGILDDILESAQPIDSIGFYEGQDRKAEIPLPTTQEQFPLLAAVPQNQLELLLSNLLTDMGISIDWNHEVSELQFTADGVDAAIDQLAKESVGYAVAHTEWVVAKRLSSKASYLIGADGHRSTVRRLLDIDFKTVADPEYFAVFEIRSDFDARNEMRIVLHDQTTNVLWPLPGGGFRWGFQLPDYQGPEPGRNKDRLAVQLGRAEYPQLEEDSLRRMIAERAPWFDGAIQEIRWRIVVRFEHRAADRFGDGRTWLVGDAAHITGPVGMHSLNAGLRESHQLARTLADILRDVGSPDQLQEYDATSRSRWRSVIDLAQGAMAGLDAHPWFAQRAGRLLPCIPIPPEDIESLVANLVSRS